MSDIDTALSLWKWAFAAGFFIGIALTVIWFATDWYGRLAGYIWQFMVTYPIVPITGVSCVVILGLVKWKLRKPKKKKAVAPVEEP